MVIAINPFICPQFGSDFNVGIFDNFAPQSFKVMVELKELKKLQQQIICSQGGQPLLGLVQNLASHSPNSQVKKVFSCQSFHGLAWYVVFISGSQCRYCEVAKRRPFVDRRALAWLMACGCKFLQEWEISKTDISSKWLQKGSISPVDVICDWSGSEAVAHHLNRAQGVFACQAI